MIGPDARERPSMANGLCHELLDDSHRVVRSTPYFVEETNVPNSFNIVSRPNGQMGGAEGASSASLHSGCACLGWRGGINDSGAHHPSSGPRVLSRSSFNAHQRSWWHSGNRFVSKSR